MCLKILIDHSYFVAEFPDENVRWPSRTIPLMPAPVIYIHKNRSTFILTLSVFKVWGWERCDIPTAKAKKWGKCSFGFGKIKRLGDCIIFWETWNVWG